MTTPAEQFKISSRFTSPISPSWEIRTDYPEKPTEDPPEWHDMDFKTESKKFSEAVKRYILKGNADKNFVVQNNTERDWYHVPWLHYGEHGREPVNGLKYAGSIPPTYISENQNRYTQVWLNSYINQYTASVLHKMWGNSSREPVWEDNLEFPVGSIIFERVLCDATGEEIYILNGSPQAKACIFERPTRSYEEPVADDKHRMTTVSQLRVIQLDFAARVERRDPEDIGWVFGTFIHDGTEYKTELEAWNAFVPVGIEWGNDPSLTQETHDDGKVSNGCWINGKALDLVGSLRGDRPWLGWHGRLNGPLDDFMSTCTSCHATAQVDTNPIKEQRTRVPFVQQPPPIKVPSVPGQPGRWVQNDKAAEKKWFRDVPAGKPWEGGDKIYSADYNRHVLFSFENYRDWDEKRDHS